MSISGIKASERELMENYFIFDERELVRVGVVCPNCNTETIFDLSKDQTANRPKRCSGCEGDLLPVCRSENEYTYDAVTEYARLLKWNNKPKILLYFKKP
jgi:peptide subunit release factor 1 (eRF1)